MRFHWVSRISLALLMAATLSARPALAQSSRAVVINEIAWMGTTLSTSDEWIELYNNTGQSISLTGWTLRSTDGTPGITLSGGIPAYGYFLLERTSDNSVPGIAANQIYTGAMTDTGELLELRNASGVLIDSANQTSGWFAGTTTGRATMSRTDATLPGTNASSWHTATASYTAGLGTPKQVNLSGQGGSSSNWYSFYITDHLNTVMPAYGPKTMARALIAALDGATTSIEFAVYGFNGSEELLDALFRAKDRGVRVRGVVDSYASGSYPYRTTQKVIERLGTVIQDNDDRIMHNKFFVIDGRKVWTGSTNLSRYEIDAEYYSDLSILIDSMDLAAVYQKEFEEMYAGRFHTLKTDNTPHVLPVLPDGTVMESYFGPTDDALHKAIVRAINEAKRTLVVRTFYLSSVDVVDALKAARSRGVSVRVILDASGAANAYSLHQAVRDAGIPVKVENWGGTEHMKALAADGYLVVLGSQNFTYSGNTDSDENTLYIQNRPLARSFESAFETAWSSIPDTWLTANPHPESTDSPGSLTDLVDNDHDDATDELAPERINTVSTSDGAINIYFLRQALTQAATPGNAANYNVNLEKKLAERIQTATSTIDLATYELNLPRVVDALLDRARNGVKVRIIADGKNPLQDDGTEDLSYKQARAHYERMLRGSDGVLGTADDARVLADSPIFAVEDPTFRTRYGLPATPEGLPYVTVVVGTTSTTGYLLADAELKSTTNGVKSYYSTGDQMHNKFAIIDGTWVWTGSWNFTIRDTYGSEENQAAGILSGHTNHTLELRSSTLAAAYTAEFNEMWGSTSGAPDITRSNFHSRKVDSGVHQVTVGGRKVEVYFSPNEGALRRLTTALETEAQLSAHFCIYAFSDQALTDTFKYLWEGSKTELVGSRTGFKVQGVFDSGYWNLYWSAALDMTGRESSPDPSYSVRWANPAPVFLDGEDSLLHHKYLIADVDSTSDPFVVTGSTNWSTNGEQTNDENMLIIHDAAVANQFYQEFGARYYMAYGVVDFLRK
ncbi:phospholipase D-like domain-containing protein [Archangium sp.]|uniref:phospholipase D-like domain-containing protein n=1 Tax=Archangium sp. TaxID=1872627 RepID=UPI002D2BD83F|nr:phospholipase D-like domain-containing protein [Archangium sp.]HYO51973.1 phospholipase D-like domain-containing protein [Archangium sp.]